MMATRASGRSRRVLRYALGRGVRRLRCGRWVLATVLPRSMLSRACGDLNADGSSTWRASQWPRACPAAGFHLVADRSATCLRRVRHAEAWRTSPRLSRHTRLARGPRLGGRARYAADAASGSALSGGDHERRRCNRRDFSPRSLRHRSITIQRPGSMTSACMASWSGDITAACLPQVATGESGAPKIPAPDLKSGPRPGRGVRRDRHRFTPTSSVNDRWASGPHFVITHAYSSVSFRDMVILRDRSMATRCRFCVQNARRSNIRALVYVAFTTLSAFALPRGQFQPGGATPQPQPTPATPTVTRISLARDRPQAGSASLSPAGVHGWGDGLHRRRSPPASRLPSTSITALPPLPTPPVPRTSW